MRSIRILGTVATIKAEIFLAATLVDHHKNIDAAASLPIGIILFIKYNITWKAAGLVWSLRSDRMFQATADTYLVLAVKIFTARPTDESPKNPQTGRSSRNQGSLPPTLAIALQSATNCSRSLRRRYPPL